MLIRAVLQKPHYAMISLDLEGAVPDGKRRAFMDALPKQWVKEAKTTTTWLVKLPESASLTEDKCRSLKAEMWAIIESARRKAEFTSAQRVVAAIHIGETEPTVFFGATSASPLRRNS